MASIYEGKLVRVLSTHMSYRNYIKISTNRENERIYSVSSWITPDDLSDRYKNTTQYTTHHYLRK